MPVELRFWSKVAIGESGECWEWLASGLPDGYGTFSFRGVCQLAHRIAFELWAGRAPDRTLFQTCENRRCCNPSHLVEEFPPSRLIPAELRFWEKVDIRGDDDCWPWLAATQDQGYGVLRDGGVNHGAHRLAFEFWHGRSSKACVLHECDSPPCCNPRHLFEGTHADNSRDMVEKGRVQRGEDRANSRLTAATVKWIRALYEYADPKPTQAELAQLYSVHQMTISDLLRGKTWKHVT